jgi:hypothetical protein
MAAGLGYKEFTTGDVLTAADANGYLASQVVMVFASAAARTSAITSPQEGMISFRKDADAMEYYSGSAWVAVDSAAGTGGWTSLATGSLSGTSTTVSVTTTGYKQLICFVKDVVCTTDWYWKLQLNSDTASNYSQINQYNNSASAVTTTNFADSGFVSYGAVEATDKNAFGVWTIYDPANTNTVKTCTGFLSAMDSGDTFRSNGIVTGQWFATPAAITSVTFVAVSTYSSGTYEIYGVK